MADKNDSPLLLFYPTSPVHVRDMHLVMNHLPDWSCTALSYRPLEKVAPGIRDALEHHPIRNIDLDQNSSLEKTLPANTAALALGAVFESFALELFAWAKLRQIPVIAIQEVAQLALNQFDINNYDAPFDRLFVASPEERRRFLKLNYPAEMLCVSGVLANDRISKAAVNLNEQLLENLGITDRKKPIVYTTSPLRSRLALHNKDDLTFRKGILTQLAEARRNTGRSVVVKLHPNENFETNRQIAQEIIADAIVVGRELSMDELLPITGVLVNRGNSQTCLDAVLRGVPTVVAACGLKTLFHDDGGAYVVDSMGTLASTIETALKRGPLDITQAKSKHFYVPANGVANYVANEIVALATAPRPAGESSRNWLIKSMLFVGRHDRALALCEMLPSRSRWQELVRLALQAHSEQRRTDAISHWLQCAALDPKWYFPHYELAHAYQATGQFDQAIAHARNAIELHPPFHSLWHEIPMRVVMMASLRCKGESAAASTELKALEQRGLIEIVPELLIEAAAQHCSSSVHLEAAEKCLEKSVEQLKLHPVDQLGDLNILERAARQHIEIAAKYAETGDSARSTLSLEQAIELARSDAGTLAALCSHLGELGEKREIAGDYGFAEQCFLMGNQADPTAYWLRYCQSRMALKQRHFRKAFHGIFVMAKIPNAPRAIIEKLLSPAGAARLAPYWPPSPKSILKPIMLWLCMSGWFFGRLARSGPRDIPTSITAVILVWLFIARHFISRL